MKNLTVMLVVVGDVICPHCNMMQIGELLLTLRVLVGGDEPSVAQFSLLDHDGHKVEVADMHETDVFW